MRNLFIIFLYSFASPLVTDAQTRSYMKPSDSLNIVNRINLKADITTLLGFPSITKLTDSLNEVRASVANKQVTLVSGTNIKTVNGTSVMGSGDISISSAVSWGGITGILSTQTDLTTALGLKAPLLSPSFTTPVLGAATATTINGGTLSGNNSGDNAVNTLYSGLAASKQNTITTGTTTQYFRGDLSLATFPTIPTNNNQLTNGAGYITSYTETDPIVKAISGLVKSNGTTISAAVANTDYALPNAVNTTYANDYRAANFVAGTNYLAPNGNGSQLTNLPTPTTISGSITESQVTNLVSDLAAKQATLVSATNIKTVNGSSLLGSGDLVVTGSGAPTFLNLTALASSVLTTEVSVTGWTFPVTIGKTYRVEVIATYQTAATSTGGELGFFLTASGAGTIRGRMEGAVASVAAATSLTQQITAIGAADLAGSNLITTGVTATNSPHYIYALVTFTCTASGTFNVGWASEVAASAATLNANSSLIYQQLN